MLGLALPASVVQTALGVIVLGIVVLMLVSKKSEFPVVAQPDRLSSALGIHGVFVDGASGRAIDWQVHRTPMGLLLFLMIGVMAGMFGIGAGWANVPALNLLMGAPLKVSAGTSGLVLSLVDSSAAWVYLNRGAVLPMVAVPSVVGMMVGDLIAFARQFYNDSVNNYNTRRQSFPAVLAAASLGFGPMDLFTMPDTEREVPKVALR